MSFPFFTDLVFFKNPKFEVGKGEHLSLFPHPKTIAIIAEQCDLLAQLKNGNVYETNAQRHMIVESKTIT